MDVAAEMLSRLEVVRLVVAEGLHATPITADIVRLVGRWGIQTEGTRVDNIDLKPLRPTEILA